MQTGHELFLHDLNDMIDAERQLVDALQENADDSSRSDLKKAFERHRQETEGQLERLQQCLELLGEQAEETECLGIRGIIGEKHAFAEEDPSDDRCFRRRRGHQNRDLRDLLVPVADRHGARDEAHQSGAPAESESEGRKDHAQEDAGISEKGETRRDDGRGRRTQECRKREVVRQAPGRVNSGAG